MRLSMAVVAACAALALSAPARGQETAPAAPQRVSSVLVTGVAGENLAAAQRAIRVRPGDVYSEEALQKDVTALLGLDFILSAKARRAVTAQGVDVVYEVTPKGRLERIEFAGNKKLKRKKLMRVGRLEDIQHYDIAQLHEAAQLMQDEYKKAGYLFAKVSYGTQPDGTFLYTIEEGPRLKVAAIRYSGNTAFPEGILKKQVLTKTRRYLILPFRLDENTLVEDKLRLQEFYRAAGYLDATVDVKLDLTRNRKGIIVIFAVNEGPLYTVKSVDIAGNQVIAAPELMAELKMTSGEPFSPQRMAADARRIRDAYGRLGYIDAEVGQRPTFPEQGTEVAVVYQISEGEPVLVKEIAILGNDKTRDNVIRREMEFYPGQVFNTKLIDESRANLLRLSYFSSVEIAPDPADRGQPARDALVTVEEAPTGQLLLGVGVNSNAGLVGQLAFIQRNFDYREWPSGWRDIADGRALAGGGQYFELNASPGTEVSQARMAYRDPRVFDSEYSFGLGFHLWEREYDEYTEKRLGGEVTFGRQFSRNAFWEAKAEADNVELSDIDEDAPDEVKRWDGSWQVNTLGLTLGHDTRDNFLLPTSGHRVTGTVEASSEAIASEFDFLRFRTDGAWYKLLARDKLDRPHVFSARARLGYLWPESAEDDPIFERFYAGGAYDMRGFEYRGMGPHEGDTAVGGRFLALGGLQYDFPLAGEVFRGALFYDTGILSRDGGDARLGDIRHSVGFGFRILIPPPLNFPMALDFGFPLRELDEDETQVISFTLGKLL